MAQGLGQGSATEGSASTQGIAHGAPSHCVSGLSRRVAYGKGKGGGWGRRGVWLEALRGGGVLLGWLELVLGGVGAGTGALEGGCRDGPPP